MERCGGMSDSWCMMLCCRGRECSSRCTMLCCKIRECGVGWQAHDKRGIVNYCRVVWEGKKSHCNLARI